mmetsp:Transcript_14851/g.32758  ORF Transcript_14851/g.32758 Transcript_14851/m.32758 type:complete len:219 (-) Transcript_14851:1365-2021(-)
MVVPKLASRWSRPSAASPSRGVAAPPCCGALAVKPGDAACVDAANALRAPVPCRPSAGGDGVGAAAHAAATGGTEGGGVDHSCTGMDKRGRASLSPVKDCAALAKGAAELPAFVAEDPCSARKSKGGTDPPEPARVRAEVMCSLLAARERFRDAASRCASTVTSLAARPRPKGVASEARLGTGTCCCCCCCDDGTEPDTTKPVPASPTAGLASPRYCN